MRNRTLDMVKAICAYAVVLLHVHFPGNAGIIANVLARFAVPVFFMVSGYFCFRGDDTEFIRTGKKIRHVLKLMLVAFPVCCLWELIQNHIDGASQKEWLEALVSGEHIRQFLLYNNSSQVKWHLWFIPALLYCYLLFALAARFRICKQAYVLIPVLLLIHFGMEEFSTFLFPPDCQAFQTITLRGKKNRNKSYPRTSKCEKLQIPGIGHKDQQHTDSQNDHRCA